VHLSAVPLLNRLRDFSYWRNRGVLSLVGLSLAINLVALGYVALKYPNLPEFLPLHYNAMGDVDDV